MTPITAFVAKSPGRSQRVIRPGASSLEYAMVAFLVLVMVALLSMGLLRARESARDQLCLRRLVLLANAINEVASVEGGYPGYVSSSAGSQVESRSWVAATIPYLDERLPLIEATANGWKIREKPDLELQPKSERPWQSWKTALQRSIPQLICPNEDTAKLGKPGATSYVASCGYPDAPKGYDRPDFAANGIFLDLRKLPQITAKTVQSLDGTEFTLLLSENVQSGSWDSLKEAEIGFVWTERLARVDVPSGFAIPESLPINQALKDLAGGYKTARPSSRHVGAAHAIFANTRLSKIANTIDPVVYIRLCTVDDTQLMNPWSRTPIGPPIGRQEPAAGR